MIESVYHIWNNTVFNDYQHSVNTYTRKNVAPEKNEAKAVDASLWVGIIGFCLLVCFAVYYLHNSWEWERNARHLLAYGRDTPCITPIGTKSLSKPDNKNPSDGHPLNLWNPPYLSDHHHQGPREWKLFAHKWFKVVWRKTTMAWQRSTTSDGGAWYQRLSF